MKKRNTKSRYQLVTSSRFNNHEWPVAGPLATKKKPFNKDMLYSTTKGWALRIMKRSNELRLDIRR